MIIKLDFVSKGYAAPEQQSNFLCGFFPYENYEIPVCVMNRKQNDENNQEYLTVANDCAKWVMENEDKIFQYFMGSFIEQGLENVLGELSITDIIIFYEEKYFSVWLNSYVDSSHHSLYTLLNLENFNFFDDAILYD